MLGLNTGFLALQAAQRALDVIGNNVANVGTEGYRRQSASLTSTSSMRLGGLYFGTGVALSDIRRAHDSLLDDRLRTQLAEQSHLSTGLDILEEAEFTLGEPSDTALAAKLGAFYDSLDALTAGPSDSALQNDAIQRGVALSSQFQRVARELDTIDRTRSERLENTVAEINSLGETLADLNRSIAEARTIDGVPPDLLDRRDILLRDLSELVDIDVRIAEDQTAEVQAGSVLLVGRGGTPPLELFTDDGGRERLRVQGRSSNGFVPAGGEVLGLMATGKEPLQKLRASLDDLARGVITQLNRVHATGVGTAGSFTRLTSSFEASDASQPLVAAGLVAPMKKGAFMVTVRNTGTGDVVRTPIRFDPNKQSLADLANSLDGVGNLNAKVTGDGRLDLTADGGFTFDFTAESGTPRDSTGLLGALGLNAFFTGSDARTIAVSAELEAHPERIATSATGEPLDNANVLSMTAERDAVNDLLGGSSVEDFYRRQVSEVGFQVSQLQALSDSQTTLVSSLEARQESLTGVSLEEELIDLERFQTSFEAASRYLQVINQTTDAILSLGF